MVGTVWYCLDVNHALLFTEMAFLWDVHGVNHEVVWLSTAQGLKVCPSSREVGTDNIRNNWLLVFRTLSIFSIYFPNIRTWGWRGPTQWRTLHEIYILIVALLCGGRNGEEGTTEKPESPTRCLKRLFTEHIKLPQTEHGLSPGGLLTKVR